LKQHDHRKTAHNHPLHGVERSFSSHTKAATQAASEKQIDAEIDRLRFGKSIANSDEQNQIENKSVVYDDEDSDEHFKRKN
jgi:hypothetical protein